MASSPPSTGGITTIMPVFNGERYIEAAIESLLAQSLPPRQIVVVDDGSTDESGARAVAAGQGLVALVRQQNRGINPARERGLSLVTGDYVHFMDSDDLCPEGALERMYRELQDHADWHAVFGTWRNFWIEELAAESERDEAAHLRGNQTNFIASAALFRADWIRGFGPITGDSWHGPILWLAEAQRSGARFGRTDALVLERRIHHTNFSRRKTSEDLVNLVLNLHRSARRSGQTAVGGDDLE